MGMGFSGSYADVIPWETLKRLCPKASSAIEEMIQTHDFSMDDFVQFLEWEVAEDLPDGIAPERLHALFDDLEKEFQAATSVGDSVLELCPIYHDSENAGDRYDDVDGGFFHVEGLYQLSPAGKKIADKIERKSFVRFG